MDIPFPSEKIETPLAWLASQWAPLFLPFRSFLSAMSFPSYLWSNMDFHAHRFHYWYVINALSVNDEMPEESTDAVDAEVYAEIYSDY